MSLTERIQDHMEWLKTPEGKASMEESWKKIEAKMARQETWAIKIAEYVQSLSKEELDKIFKRFLEWETKYEDAQYKKCIQTTSRLFARVMDAVERLGEDFEEQEDFFAHGYIYKNYIFKTYCGQGCFTRILDISKPIKDEVIFQTT